MILSGADNRLPLLDKDLYDSWKSIMELYMQNREHGRMILESVENDPLIWPTFEEIGVTRTKKYVKLSVTEKIQADCDMKATNIILQGLPADIYLLVNHHRVAKDLWESLITNARQYTKPKRPSNAAWYKDKAMLAEAYEAGHVLDEEKLAFLADPGTEDLDTYDSDCDDILNAKAVLMANIFNYGSDVISKWECLKAFYSQHAKVALMANLSRYGSDVLAVVHNPDNIEHNMISQSVQAIPSSE
nr:hypothetical protein [Tanacetum cinerariifolium]